MSEGMRWPAQSEDPVTTTETDLYGDVLLRHLFEHGCTVGRIHHIRSMSNALRVSDLDGFLDVAAQFFRRDLPESQLAGMERDIHAWRDAMQHIEHLHVQIVIVHRDEPILRLNKI